MKRLSICLATFALVACGGGGGGSTPVAVAPAPTVAVSLAQSKVSVGTPVTLTWSSTNATSCTGMDALSGTKAINDSLVITPTVGGQYIYTISCDGAGGTVKQSAALVVPFPVLKTSVENQNNVGLGRVNFSAVPNIPPGGPQGFAAADFFQTGHIDIFTSNWNYDMAKPWPVVKVDPTSYSDLQFWRQQPDGTLTLLLEYKNQGCILGRKAAVADFNKDGYPDVVLACHGYDAPVPDGNGGMYFPGEYSKLLLSDGKGGFTISNFADSNGFVPGVSAGDVNGDGWPDIMISGATVNGEPHMIRFYMNNKDGTFTEDTSRVFNSPATGGYNEPNDLIDVDGDGILDLAVGGNVNTETAILYGDADGTFGKTRKLVIPPIPNRAIVMQFVLVVNNGERILYMNRTSEGGSNVGNYNTETVQRLNLTTHTNDIVYDSVGDNTGPNHWFTWILPQTRNGQVGVVPYGTMYQDVFIQ